MAINRAPPNRLAAGIGGEIGSESELVALCLALIGGTKGLSPVEYALIDRTVSHVLAPDLVETTRRTIIKGHDPLGEAFELVRSALARRSTGAVYTPVPIVKSMMSWIASQGLPLRIVDPGSGSGRFILAAGEAFPKAHLVAVELDPLAALMLRANLAVRGWSDRADVHVKDYRELTLPRCTGMTAFVGNPPYVRHHDISGAWKAWYSGRFATMGIRASALAGLHLHFFLQTRLLSKPGDVGAFITSSEWLDVNYGSALRRLLLDELGGIALHVLEPTVEAFPGTATTTTITCFRVGETNQAVRMQSVKDLAQIKGLVQGVDVPRAQLHRAPRWSIIMRPGLPATDGDLELGELFRVHRGQVTGANGIWIAGEHANGLPERVRIPSVTKARDLLRAGERLVSTAPLRRVVDLPPDLDDFSGAERKCIQTFLAWARAQGVHEGYIARHRKAWWAVGLKDPAPILCTYMARRPPQFTLNDCGARHINVAHGLYPRQALPQDVLAGLVSWLNINTTQESGRTYAGGLTKFEPREVERLRIPSVDRLQAHALHALT